MKRLLGISTAGLVGLAAMALAMPIQAAPPTVVVSAKSVEALLDDADCIGAAVGTAGVKDEAESAINGWTSGSGLAGVDREKPFGAYWNITTPAPDEIGKVVVFLPVSDAAKLGELLKSVVPDFKDTDGEWSMTIGGTPVFAKISNGYCFASTSTEALANLIDPSKFVDDKYDLAIDVNLSGIPREQKSTFLKLVEEGARKSMEEGPPPKNEAEDIGQQIGFDGMLAIIKAVTNDGDRLTLGFDVDLETRITSIDLGLTSEPKSALAKSMAVYGKTTPAFAAVASESAPFRLVLSHPTSWMIEKSDQLFKALRKTTDAEIDKDEKLEDAADKKAAKNVAKRLFDITQATINSGSLHSVVILDEGDDDTVRFIGGIKVAKGDDAGKLLDDMLKLSKESPDYAKVKPDVAKHAGARIHEITPDLNDKQTAMFGESPAHLAIRADSLWMSMGGGNLDALKAVLDLSGKKTSKTDVPISLRTKPAMLVKLMEHDNEALIARAKALAGEPGDVFNIEIAPVDSTGAKLHIQFGLDLFKLGIDQ